MIYNKIKNIKEGYKTFEIRFNDRDFKEGDVLQLQEFENNNYTLESIYVEVIAVLKDYPGVKEDYVLMYIEKLIRKEAQKFCEDICLELKEHFDKL